MNALHREAVVTIDGELVALECDRLTVKEFNVVASLTWLRGSEPGQEPRALRLRRLQLIDAHVRPKVGQVFVDGHDYSDACDHGMARLFGAREDVIGALYEALLSAQQLSHVERHALEVAARFTHWLEAANKKQSASTWIDTGTSCQKCHEQKLCERRRCHGRPTKKVVWHDKKLILNVCPILSFTPEVETTLRLFYWTHDLVANGYALQWQQKHLLAPGGLEDQDAWMTGAFGWLRGVHAELIHESLKHG